MGRPNYYMQQEAAERERFAAEAEKEEQRMAAYDAGLCSLGAAWSGGPDYEREIADSLTELKAEGVAQPVATAVNGWLKAIATTRKAA
jgi:hypothetical protein